MKTIKDKVKAVSTNHPKSYFCKVKTENPLVLTVYSLKDVTNKKDIKLSMGAGFYFFGDDYSDDPLNPYGTIKLDDTEFYTRAHLNDFIDFVTIKSFKF